MEKFDNRMIFLRKQLILSYYHFFSHVNYRSFKNEQAEFEASNKFKSLEEKIEYDKIIFDSHKEYTEKIRNLLDVYLRLSAAYNVQNVSFEDRNEFMSIYGDILTQIDILLYKIKNVIFDAIEPNIKDRFTYVYEWVSNQTNNRKIEENCLLYVNALNVAIDEGRIDIDSLFDELDEICYEAMDISEELADELISDENNFVRSKINIGFLKYVK